jgi:UDP-GlcNAc:undecaprenyl-phosphate/decaprenyl-phosphate GlcNAc-1-phosphate transferase
MYSIFTLIFTSMVASLLLTPLVSSLGWRLGIVDLPDQKRKVHTSPIPRLGGVAILAAVVAAYILLLAVRLTSGVIVWDGMPLILRLLPALGIVFGIGFIDDLFGLQPWKKLTAEIIAAIMAWFGGIHISTFAGHSFTGVVARFALTILWLVVCTNAINLIDGVDGLAAGVCLFAAASMLVAAVVNHNIPMALAVAPFAGAILGFLRYNFNPASIFLGDCGSLGLGFLLGCCGAVWSEKSTTLLGMTAPLLVLLVPLLDVGLAVARRFLRGHNIFGADQAHIHHKLLSRGLTPRRLVFVIYGICGVSAAAALLLTINHDNDRGFVIILICLAACLGMQYLGYTEFGVARRLFRDGLLRNVLNAQLDLDAFEEEVYAEPALVQSWEILSRSCPRFGFSGIVFRIGDVTRRWGTNTGWQTRIEFPGHGYINLWRESEASGPGVVAALFADRVSRTFSQKLSSREVIEHK